ncbi:metaxin-2-like [Dreissena polymorpha]|uniref:Metaxin-2 n=1 Tax=Dreissena polymorpha TaxID=45954 RepID=A0A9D3YS41_DREPO|nr:metaxin-2-like [Dreissena polymorpha]KAH3703854.1 hypothetical protein DPMN_078901 [Dreissena polymorpha]
MLMEAVKIEMGATERWPDNVKLYQQYQAEQITFPDYAASLSVKTFLYMCGLEFSTVPKINAEEMSPSGRVPFIHIGPFLVSEFEPIVAYVQTRGFGLNDDLTDVQKSELKAYIKLIGSTLVNAELYLSWLVPEVYEKVTKARYGAMYAWPLNCILPYQKFLSVQKQLAASEWKNKTFAEVCEEVETCCQALNDRLGTQNFFFGKKPTELDALVFGHISTLLTTDLPRNEFADIIRRYDNLLVFLKRIDAEYFDALRNSY